jgi:hypothetical protein
VNEAQSKGFETTTVGSVMASKDSSISDTDPHYSLTSNFISRVELIKDAIKIAIGQLARATK